MSKGTCTFPACDKDVLARGFCPAHYQRARKDGTLQLLPPNPTHHRLTEIDEEARTALCQVCGPTGIRVREGRSPECRTHHIALSQQARKRRYEADPILARYAWVSARYKLTRERYDALVEAQGGRCALCLRAPKGNLHVDHDHRCCPGGKSCGECVRGLLCLTCNNRLKEVDDDPEYFLRAAEYLTRAQAAPLDPT